MKYLFIYLFLTVGCASRLSNPTLAGKYVSPKRSKINIVMANLNGRIYPSTTLQLRTDSTCTYSTCAMVMEGRWKARNDTLYISYIDKAFKIDSLNNDPKYMLATRLSPVPDKYKISRKSNSLKRAIHCTDGYTIVDELVKQ